MNGQEDGVQTRLVEIEIRIAGPIDHRASLDVLQAHADDAADRLAASLGLLRVDELRSELLSTRYDPYAGGSDQPSATSHQGSGTTNDIGGAGDTNDTNSGNNHGSE